MKQYKVIADFPSIYFKKGDILEQHEQILKVALS